MNKSVIYSEIGETLNNKKYLPKDIDITSRQINYWKEKNIVPFFRKEKKGFMNLPEALWLMIINELSDIGIDSKKLEKLSFNIWLKPFYEKYADEVFNSYLNDKKDSITEEEKGWLSHYLENEHIMVDVFRRIINPFTNCIKDSLISNRVLYSFIYSPNTEEYLFSKSGLQLNSELNNLFYAETVITIPFLPHLSKLIGIEIDKQKEDIEYLTNVENIIRRTLIFDKPKLMEIEVLDNGEKKICKITESHKKSEELARFFLNTKLPAGAKVTIEARTQGNYKVTIKS